MNTPKKRIGRPPVAPENRLIGRSIRLTQEQWDKVDAAGMAALRKAIDRLKPRDTAHPRLVSPPKLDGSRLDVA